VLKKSCWACLICVLLMAASLTAAEQKLGKPVDLKTTTAIKAILAEPDKYLGKEVKVEGEITQVCQMAGCWIMVKDASSSEPIMVKVDDGVIVFPKDGAGKKVVAQGKLEKVADEAQKEAGSKSAYRIKGSGAIVK
jgi:RecJ-like exonuclease